MRDKKSGGGFFLFIVALYIVIPLLVTVIYSFTFDWTSIVPRGFTLRFYADLFSKSLFWADILRTVLISIIPVLMTSFMVILALYVAVVYAPWLEKFIEMLCMVPYTINGVVLATAVLATYAGSGTIFSNRIVMLICIYSIGCLPITFRAIRNNMYAVNLRQLIEAAEILGAGKLYAFLRVVVPCMVSGIMVSTLMCVAGIFADYAVIRIIASSSYETVMVYLYESRNFPIQFSSAILTVMMIITFTIAFTALWLQMRDKTKAAVRPVLDEE
ncbi:MAG: ABC transporter permease subunit [Treponema sp.]|nr:ABC transporter permease subunit [Treponema sp.]